MALGAGSGSKQADKLKDSAGRDKLAKDIRAARQTRTDKEDRQVFNQHTKLLKQHREGTSGITETHAAVIRNRFAKKGAEARRLAAGPGKSPVIITKKKDTPKVDAKIDMIQTTDQLHDGWPRSQARRIGG